MFDTPVLSVVDTAYPGARWFAVGAAVMGFAALYFTIRGRGIEDPRERGIHVVTVLVPAVAFGSYLAMALGVGVAEVAVRGGTLELHWARYADWLFTTPLLLIGLGLFVGADGETLFGAVAADVFMIVTGVAATLSGVPIYRYVWWGISSIALLFVMYFVVVALDRKARERDEATRSAFAALRLLIGASWAAYPVWWLMGTGFSLVSPSVEAFGFALLDTVAKVGFGMILLHSPALVGSDTPEGATTGAPAE
jgi:bacteriorhodopsin